SNGLAHVRLHCLAAGAGNGTARLVNPGTESRIELSEGPAQGQAIEVPIRSLDEVFAGELRPGEKLDLVQIDVEGAEFEVLKGLERTIARDRPLLLIELHGPLLPKFGSSKAEVLDWLARRGYEAHWIAMEALDDPGFSFAVFRPR